MRIAPFLLAGVATAISLPCPADVVLDVHAVGMRAARAAGMPAAVAANSLALASVAMFDAANAIEGGYRPYRAQAAPPAGADPDAAALGAGCGVLAASLASQASAVTTACDGLAAAMPASDGVRDGRTFGDAVGKAAVAARQAEVKAVANTYRPRTTPGVYVPTPLPIGFDFANATPWAMTSQAQFRPGPPPGLDSAAWVRDYNEVRTMGGRGSTARTPEQTATALFWASNGPQQFMDSVPDLPFTGNTTRRARLLALFYMGMLDASIAVFDAKYAYDFWRPITAIRNGDEDNNPATGRDPVWTPLVDTPLHQEYPCAHCAVTAAIVTVLAAEVGDGELAKPVTFRPADLVAATAKPRSWNRLAQITPEVGNARVWGGVHFRNSTEAGLAMGWAAGKQALETRMAPVGK